MSLNKPTDLIEVRRVSLVPGEPLIKVAVVLVQSDLRKIYWALRAVEEFELAADIDNVVGPDEEDHGEDLAEKWGVRL